MGTVLIVCLKSALLITTLKVLLNLLNISDSTDLSKSSVALNYAKTSL